MGGRKDSKCAGIDRSVSLCYHSCCLSLQLAVSLHSCSSKPNRVWQLDTVDNWSKCEQAPTYSVMQMVAMYVQTDACTCSRQCTMCRHPGVSSVCSGHLVSLRWQALSMRGCHIQSWGATHSSAMTTFISVSWARRDATCMEGRDGRRPWV